MLYWPFRYKFQKTCYLRLYNISLTDFLSVWQNVLSFLFSFGQANLFLTHFLLVWHFLSVQQISFQSGRMFSVWHIFFQSDIFFKTDRFPVILTDYLSFWHISIQSDMFLQFNISAFCLTKYFQSETFWLLWNIWHGPYFNSQSLINVVVQQMKTNLLQLNLTRLLSNKVLKTDSRTGPDVHLTAFFQPYYKSIKHKYVTYLYITQTK